MQCPACQGTGRDYAQNDVIYGPCSFCAGTGAVSQETWETVQSELRKLDIGLGAWMKQQAKEEEE